MQERGLVDLAEKIRTALPSKARMLLKEELEKNEQEWQDCIRKKGRIRKNGWGHTKFEDRADAIKGALRELEQR